MRKTATLTIDRFFGTKRRGRAYRSLSLPILKASELTELSLALHEVYIYCSGYINNRGRCPTNVSSLPESNLWKDFCVIGRGNDVRKRISRRLGFFYLVQRASMMEAYHDTPYIIDQAKFITIFRCFGITNEIKKELLSC
jgi:hypothetical protein